MIIYEITTTVEPEKIENYEKYMREQHMPDLVTTGFFESAKMVRSSAGRYRICYELRDQKSLDEYFANDADRLRKDFLDHFPEGVEVSREVWEIIENIART